MACFVITFITSLAAVYFFILILDPYGIVLPLTQRELQYGNQRTLYPQIVRSKRFDAFIVGTSTARLIDPQILNAPFAARFANLSMNSMLAWEQKTMMEYLIRVSGPPKVLIVALDGAWCVPDADKIRFLKEGFPDWLYDDDRWNDYLYLLNIPTLKLALRQVLYNFGLVFAHVRDDGYGVFVPPDEQYDILHVRQKIWAGQEPKIPADARPFELSESGRQALNFPALPWLDAILAKLPSSTRKVLAYMPVHVASQPVPGTKDAVVEAECKSRIATIARARGAMVIDWRFASPLTREDSNYWDSLHYRLPVANRITHDLAAAVLERREAQDGSYRFVVP